MKTLTYRSALTIVGLNNDRKEKPRVLEKGCVYARNTCTRDLEYRNNCVQNRLPKKKKKYKKIEERCFRGCFAQRTREEERIAA